jgi:hypothetical protein
LFNENPLPINQALAVVLLLTGITGIIVGTGKDS